MKEGKSGPPGRQFTLRMESVRSFEDSSTNPTTLVPYFPTVSSCDMFVKKPVEEVFYSGTHLGRLANNHCLCVCSDIQILQGGSVIALRRDWVCLLGLIARPSLPTYKAWGMSGSYYKIGKALCTKMCRHRSQTHLRPNELSCAIACAMISVG